MMGNIILGILALVTLYQIVLSYQNRTKSKWFNRATWAVFFLLMYMLVIRVF